MSQFPQLDLENAKGPKAVIKQTEATSLFNYSQNKRLKRLKILLN